MRGAPAIEQIQRGRLLFVGLALTVFAGVIAQRLYWYQIVDHPRFAAMANDEHQQRRPLTPKRGALLDTKGNPLTLSVMFDAVYVYKPEIANPERTGAFLATTLDLPKEDVSERIRRADRQWTVLAARVPANTAARIEHANLAGVELRRIPAREYPEGSLAAQVLGFIGMDGRGLSGLELTLDPELAGKAGIVLTERDTVGGEISIARKALVPAVPGSDVVLTIDRYLQRVVEQELASAVKANKATGGIIIVMEPATGAILAMASLPTYSLTTEASFDAGRQQLYKPVAVTDTYEPGSVMKLVTMAAALEERVVNPDSRYQDNGVALVNGVPIRNWDGGAYGNVTVRQILVHSLNTGAQWVAGLLGPDRFYHYVDAFGFGVPTGVRLNGEAPGSFRRPGQTGWSRTDLATNSFGQSISVTPLQMITAVAALANGGVRMQPQLVREVRGRDGVHTIAPRAVQAAVSPGTAETMVDVMVSVWNQPALQTHRLEGYTLAAKSGTADIPGPAGYGSGKTYASFVGFGPIPDPRFAILVRIDRPEALYGGVVAAPVFRSVASEILKHLRIPPDELEARAGARPPASDARR